MISTSYLIPKPKGGPVYRSAKERKFVRKQYNRFMEFEFNDSLGYIKDANSEYTNWLANLTPNYFRKQHAGDCGKSKCNICSFEKLHRNHNGPKFILANIKFKEGLQELKEMGYDIRSNHPKV